MAETETEEWNQPSLTGLSKLCHYESRQICRFNHATLLQHNPNPRDSQGKNRFRLKIKIIFFLSYSLSQPSSTLAFLHTDECCINVDKINFTPKTSHIYRQEGETIQSKTEFKEKTWTEYEKSQTLPTYLTSNSKE